MSSNQTQDEKGIFPCSIDIPATPSPDQTLARPKQSITPRGPRFLNLDEAHRNITSRLVFDRPFRKPSGESQSSANIPLQELSSPTSTNSFDNPGELRRHASDFVSPYPSRSMAGRSLTDRQSNARHRKTETAQHIKTSITEKNSDGDHNVDQGQNHDITSSTVCRIVDQYAATSSERVSSSLDISESAYTFEPPSQTQEVEPRLGFRGEMNQTAAKCSAKIHRNTTLQSNLRLSGVKAGNPTTVEPSETNPTEIYSTYPSENNWLGDLDLQSGQLFTLAQSTSPQVPSRGSVDGFDDECNRVVNGSHYPTRTLIPSPLRIPYNRSQSNFTGTPDKYPANDNDSSLGAEHGDASTDSNNDPFKYDNDYYRRIRQLGKEREVSCALGRLNQSDTFAQNIVDNSNTSPVEGDELMNSAQDRTNVTAQIPANVSHPRGSFFDPVAFRALHGDILCSQDAGVKVVINKATNTGNQQTDNPNSSTFGLSVDPENHMQGKSPYGQATDGDWITEATSETDLNTVSCKGHFTRGIKETGSSIADYSDDGFGTPFSKFGSQDRILQHSAEGSDGDERHMRNLTKRSDNLSAQIIRSDVTAHGRSRFNPSLARSTNSQAGMFNPFRRDYKRADASSYFTYKTDHNGPSRYEFRDSTSTYDPVVHNHQAICGSQGTIPSTSMASINTVKLLDENADPFTSSVVGLTSGGDEDSHKHRCGYFHQSNTLNPPTTDSRRHSTLMINEQDRSIQQTASDYEEGPPSTISKFSFKLLDLSEAQELEKLRRASEETSKIGPKLKYHRSLSKSSARSTPLPVPSAAYLGGNSHVRKGSRLSSTFTPPSWQIIGGDGTPGTSEYTALDASASASRALTMPYDIGPETPTATKNRFFKSSQNSSLNSRRNWFLPTDKRIRSNNSDRRLQSVMNSDMTTARVAEDHYISYKAKSRRRLFFYAMLCLSTLPFFALLVLNGNFDNSLAWLTHGEVCRLTKKQRRAIKLVFVVECVIYASLVAAIIVYYVAATRAHR